MRFRHLVLVILIALGGLSVAPLSHAQIGFQAQLQDWPSSITDYREPSYEFSAAMGARTFPRVNTRFELTPIAIRSSADSGTITLATRLPSGDTLTPVTVDAYSYSAYRRKKQEREAFRNASTGALRPEQQGRRREGLNIGFSELPKRFDKIFGEGGANLKITGYRRISFSGRSQWQDGAESDLLRQSKFPSLQMEQISRFDITGTIGSKITVSVSQDNQTDIPLANTIQIRYKGDDDDILKSIEAGNTNLSLPNTRFVGYSQRIQGLFGVKAEAQIGNLYLTGIASQEKGSTEKTTISATGKEAAQFKRDTDYESNRIYDLVFPGELNPQDKVTNVIVYEEMEIRRDPEARYTYIEPLRGNPDDTLYRELVTMIPLEPDQYQFYNDSVQNEHYVYFRNRRSDSRARAVFLVIERYPTPNDTIVDTIGNIVSDTLSLRVIHGAGLYDSDHPAWDLMWRNIYDMPRNTGLNDLDIKVFRGLPGQEATTTSLESQFSPSGSSEGYYLEILGLDQYNRQDQKIPDNLVDDRREVFNEEWGLLIFPDRRPFDSDTTFVTATGQASAPLRDRVPDLYDYTSTTEKARASQYYIQYTGQARSSVINLNRVNIIEGSEVVTVNGEVLQRGVGYNIQYDFGQITLLDDRAIDPNADVSIDYEYAPFLAVQKKTLFGLRADYEWSRDLKFGATVLYKSDKAQDRKPRVGQETAKTLVMAGNLEFKIYPSFLTKAVDAIPGVVTDAQSQISVQAEVAQSRPNPNVDDVAYVDDFEAALDQLDLGRTRLAWQVASPPAQLPNNYNRGKMLWHLPQYLVRRNDVYDVEVAQGENSLNTLRLIYRPQNREILPLYDTTGIEDIDTVINDVDTTFDTTYTLEVIGLDTSSTQRPSWAGIMRGFEGRIDDERAELLELRLRGRRDDTTQSSLRGVLHIEFGRINEDVDGLNSTYNEDQNNNGVTDIDEDVGLDGEPDVSEPGYDPVFNPDPNGDNFWTGTGGKCPLPEDSCAVIADIMDPDNNHPLFNQYYYEWLNGTEGNRDDIVTSAQPDEEVLGRSQNLLDSYFSFKLDFNSGEADSFFVEGTGRKGWYTYRIPIRDPDAVDFEIGDPKWNQVSHIRVWFESDQFQTVADTIEIADWYIVQSNWQDTLNLNENIPMTTQQFVVASVSTEDATFEPPPGVEPYTDPTQNVEEAQRGLALLYESIRPGDTCIASRELITSESYSGYRSIEMYVHGDSNLVLNSDTVGIFFRLGRDSLNFYEYQTEQLLYPGWDERNYVKIDFNAITAFKDSVQRISENLITIDTTSGNYRVKGRPNINQIKYFAVGMLNKSADTSREVTGEIWLDELRVTGVRRDVGTAGRLQLTGNAADLLTYGLTFQSRDPYFRGLSSSTRGGSQNNLGSGQTENQLSWNASINLHKFLPRSWGASLPLSFNYSNVTRLPLLKTGSDIVLPEEARQIEKTTSVSKSFRISESFRKQGAHPLIDILLNRQTFSFSYSRSDRSSVNQPFYLGENYSISGSYDAGIAKPPTVPIFFWTKWIPIAKRTAGSRLSLYPTQWRLQGQLDRRLSISEDADRRRVTSLKKDFSGNMNLTYQVFENLRTTLRYTTNRDLTDPELINITLSPKDFKLGLETNYSQSFSADYDPKLLSFLSTKWGFSSSYRDNYERSTESRKSDLSSQWSVSGQFDHMKLFNIGSGEGGSRGRAPRRGGRSGEESSGRPFYDPPLALLRFLTNWIDPLGYKYQQNYNSSLPGMVDRPGLKYQFGLSRTADVSTITESRSPSSSEGEAYDFNSGFTLLGGIATDVRFKRTISRDLVRQGTRLERRTTKWPDLTIRISEFTTLPVIKPVVNKFISIFAPRTGFSRDEKEDYDLDNNFQLNETVTTSYNPLLSLNFRLFRSLSLTSSYSVTQVNTRKFNQTDGSLDNESRSTKKSLAFATRYQFTAPGGIGIPLFGNLKFTSTVSIDLNVRFNSDLVENARRGEPFAVTTDKSDITIGPNISYTFSQQIKGGLSARWQDSNDNTLNKKSHVRELQIWTEIRF